MLKRTFDAEQSERDILIDRVDDQVLREAAEHSLRLKEHDVDWNAKLNIELMRIREERVQAFADSLEGVEKQKFAIRRELWITDPECFIDARDTELYDKFHSACNSNVSNELLEYAIRCLTDCEAAQRDIRLGEYGRQYQFVDSEFIPSELSLGDGEALSHILGWRCSPGIKEGIDLFEGGTHPDDICEGVFKNGWLLSALGMLSAAGSYGKGLINEQIRELFVPHPSLNDGIPTLETEVGAYCVKIFRNGEWIPVLVDDLFPMRQKEYWTNENRGIAVAHVRECRALWVPLIEKAFAKYYGSYSKLEKGYVHHALQDLTGCDAECICLSPFARGMNKFALWDQLVEFKRNGYILGAGTGSSDLVDREILEMGICFNSAYIIYDIKMVDYQRLLKLRNPPGDHLEWKGDWSDHSPLWTKRLKHKVGYKDNDRDNTFFMAFDDFLNVFRYLYVCKYYNPKKWIEIKQPGMWKKPDESQMEQMDIMNQFLLEQGETVPNVEVDIEAQNKKRLIAKLDSAGGLPSRHNPGCILENNPHYSLKIYRPTDLRITVAQVKLPGVRGALKIQPFSIIVVRNEHPTIPTRLSSLKKEDVVYSTGEPKYEKIQNLYINAADPGLYMVLVGVYIAGMEGHFELSVFSNYRCDCTPIWPPPWMMRDQLSSENEDKVANKTKRRMVAGGKTAQKGIESFGKAMRQGLKALVGQSTEDFDDDDDDSGSGAKSKEKDDEN
jgi:hypothetical protein